MLPFTSDDDEVSTPDRIETVAKVTGWNAERTVQESRAVSHPARRRRVRRRWPWTSASRNSDRSSGVSGPPPLSR